jgi:hypothetical protein
MSESSTTQSRTIQQAPDRDLLIELRRGLCQEVAGLKEQLQGKRQQLNAVERRLGMANESPR